MESPAVELYTPPVKLLVPAKLTACAPDEVHQGEPEYEMVAVGSAVMLMFAVAGTAGHPPEAGVIYVTV